MAGGSLRRSTRGYQPDLAHVHDVGFGAFSRDAAPWILATLRERGLHAGLVVDLGCGSGLLAQRLARAGYEVLGVDLSPAMIALARRRVPRARFVVASYVDVALPRCVAVTALGECLNYAFDARVGAPGAPGVKSLARICQRVHAALEPGGVFVFDVALPGRGAGAPVRHRAGPGWEVVSEGEEDGRRSLLTRRITTFRRVGRLYRRSVEVHRLRLYAARDVLAALRRAGFSARLLRGYGRERFPPAYAGFLARKARSHGGRPGRRPR